ncbi:conserved membrane hypothetical protein [Desulfamplus magnetovallimortis]|uniref:Uncharacterized protein n=1 Tax=Desulfamplus magnetovallimortis TaxID=1246637 RepID=A0A1W1HIS5_9BACT|nr:hypothetical protein [Desulfamplus magnetovallimortis]SLM32411.1 conserved membrane hypothetical protein [Desulfamplus magnetovallimortis]
MSYDDTEDRKLEQGWKTIIIIWMAMLASLGIYLIVFNLAEIRLNMYFDASLPLDTIRYALYGVSVATLVGVFYLRSYLLDTKRPFKYNQNKTPQHPAVARYSITVIICLALLESIGIYGVVLFLLSGDIGVLYQLIAVSAAGMIYFRPRKEELIALADEITSMT